ncbi:MAG: cysteine desulfurase NifS [Desulfobacteraceae bacterium 4572_87]|nr:MAG: cysteine desulfurase NifS [Desulfobacteraceae bacterium 4572_87]
MTKSDLKYPIYLDHNGTTPIASEAVSAMKPFMAAHFGNPSSSHSLGVRARDGVDRARKEVAKLLGCDAHEIIFTSGGTESNNMVLKGLVDFRHPETFHVITSSIEHPAILNPALFLGELGVRVTILPVDTKGLIDPDQVQKAILPHTGLITLMLANNETGALQPIREIAEIARNHRIPLHTDAAQAVGKISVQVKALGVDFLSVAGHKLYGPKGVGTLYMRDGLSLTPLIHGAGQENGRRAGTENTILTVGLGAACRVARERLTRDEKNISRLRDQLQTLLFNGIKDLVLNGPNNNRIPNTLNVSVPGLEGGRILSEIPNLMASTGAACHDQGVTLSHVLSAMGVSPRVGMGALRFSLGRHNTPEEIEEAALAVIHQVKRMRG